MRILVIQLAKMGDLLQTAPLLARLRAWHGEAELHLLHSEMFSPVAARLDVDRFRPLDLDRVVGGDGLLRDGAVTGLEGERFDLVVNPSSHRLAGQIVAKLGAPTLGHGGDDARALTWLYFAMSFIRSRRLQTLNLADIYHQLVPGPSTHYSSEWRPEWEACDLVGLQLASRNVKRQWPPAQFAAFAERLLASGARVRLLGSASEQPLAEAMLREMRLGDKVENLMGLTDIDGLFEAVKECDVLVTGDTGVMHAAAAVNTPVAAVFLGPASPWETLARGERVFAMWPDYERYPCYPCLETAPCTQNLVCHGAVKADDIWSLQPRAGLRMASVAGDELGQLLAPHGALRDEEQVGLLYRAWAADWLLGVALPQPVLDDHLAEALRRELRLWRRLALLRKPPEELSPTFRLVTPLVWFTQLCQSLNTDAPALLEGWLRVAVDLSE